MVMTSSYRGEKQPSNVMSPLPGQRYKVIRIDLQTEEVCLVQQRGPAPHELDLARVDMSS